MTTPPPSYLKARQCLDKVKEELDKGSTDNWKPELYETLAEDLESYRKRCTAAFQWYNDKANQ